MFFKNPLIFWIITYLLRYFVRLKKTSAMRIIIAGAGAVGAHLGKMLSQGKHDIVLLDPLEEKLRNIGSNIDLMTLAGSGT